MTNEITRTGCDEEEYVAIPKSEYERLKGVDDKYTLKLKEEENRLKWEEETKRINSIIKSHIPNSFLNNGLL